MRAIPETSCLYAPCALRVVGLEAFEELQHVVQLLYVQEAVLHRQSTRQP